MKAADGIFIGLLIGLAVAGLFTGAWYLASWTGRIHAMVDIHEVEINRLRKSIEALERRM